MQITRTLAAQRLNSMSAKPAASQEQEAQTSQGPSDSFTFSGGDNAGWKIAGMTALLAAIPVGVIAKNAGAGAIVGLAGVALMFGPDN